jgi:hypothetical protein
VRSTYRYLETPRVKKSLADLGFIKVNDRSAVKIMTVVWPTTSLTRTVINELTATGHERSMVMTAEAVAQKAGRRRRLTSRCPVPRGQALKIALKIHLPTGARRCHFT